MFYGTNNIIWKFLNIWYGVWGIFHKRLLVPQNIVMDLNNVMSDTTLAMFKIEALMEGSQISALQLKGWVKSKTSIQEYRNELQNLY